MTAISTIAVLGGTGAEGGGIALRLAKAGYSVVLGSRDLRRASDAAAQLREVSGDLRIAGALNRDAAEQGEIVILTVPYAAQMETVREVQPALTGKILVDATVPLMPPRVARVQLPVGGSAVAAVQAYLGESVRVVSAFQNVAAHHLRDLSHEPDCDVLVAGDHVAAREAVIALLAQMGMRGIHAGPIVNSAAAEALTSILIAVNGRYKVPGGVGLRITGILPDPARS